MRGVGNAILATSTRRLSLRNGIPAQFPRRRHSPSAVMAEAMRSIAYPSAIHDKHQHFTSYNGPTRAMHLMREEK